MESEGAAGPDGTICPGCAGTSARPVPDVCADAGAARDGLADRLAGTPAAATRTDMVTHLAEGLVMTGVCAGLGHSGFRDGDLPFAVGCSLLAVLLLAGTVWVVRGEVRGRRLVAAGRAEADRLWTPALYCPSCAAVFCPGGDPWQGLLTPEQFRKYVWTEAGYGPQLEDDVRDTDLPPGLPVRSGGTPDHV